MWRPRVVGLLLASVTIVPAVLFISGDVSVWILPVFVVLLSASIVLMCRGFRQNPCLFGGILVFVVNPLIGQVLLLWILRLIRNIELLV